MASSRISSTTTLAARGSFADMVNRAAYGKERVVVKHRGKALAAIVPIEDIQALEALEDEIDARNVTALKGGGCRLRVGDIGFCTSS